MTLINWDRGNVSRGEGEAEGSETLAVGAPPERIHGTKHTVS